MVLKSLPSLYVAFSTIWVKGILMIELAIAYVS